MKTGRKNSFEGFRLQPAQVEKAYQLVGHIKNATWYLPRRFPTVVQAEERKAILEADELWDAVQIEIQEVEL